MKHFWLGTAALSAAAAIGVAHARQPSPPPPPPVMSWTGCYVGGQVGGGAGRNTITENQQSTTTVPQFSAPPLVVNVNRTTTGKVDTSGAVAGGQLGCNYQFNNSNWLLGVQGTMMWADISGRAADSMGAGTIGVTTNSIFSFTGRVGYVVPVPNTLFYVRGGAAWANYRFDLQNAFLNFGTPSVSQMRSGWTVGTGIEWMFARDWSVFVEYNHYDFGSSTVVTFSPAALASNSLSAKTTIETGTVGVNFHFTSAGPL
jgi:outer membrane immunogenic protein